MIRNNFKHTLDVLDITIMEACSKTGLHRSVVGRIYRNEVLQIPFETMDSLCKGLDINMGNIIEYVPDDHMTDDDVEQLKVRANYNKARHRDRRDETVADK